MQQDATSPDDVRLGGPQFQQAVERIYRTLVDGLGHGFFRCSITSTIGKDRRRELLIEAGHCHKFTIPEDELPH
jgi:hypothetical protein